MGSAVVGVSASLDVHAGSSLGVSTGVLSLSVEGGIEAVSGDGRWGCARRALSVESSTSLSVSTQDAVVRASGGVEGYVSEGVSVSAGGMWRALGRRAVGVVGVGGAVVSGGRAWWRRRARAWR